MKGRLPLKHGSVRPQNLGKRVSGDLRHFIFRRRKHQQTSSFCKTLNGRLPPEDGSVRPQTLGTRVSDDPRHFIFRRQTKKVDEKSSSENFAFGSKNEISKLPILKEL